MHIRGKKSPSPFAYHQHKTLQWHATGNNNLSKLQGSATVRHQQIISNIEPNQEKFQTKQRRPNYKPYALSIFCKAEPYKI